MSGVHVRSRRELGSSAEFLLRIARANDRLPAESAVSKLRERGRKRHFDPPLQLSVKNVNWVCREWSGGQPWGLHMKFRDENGEWRKRTITPQFMEDRVYG